MPTDPTPPLPQLLAGYARTTVERDQMAITVRTLLAGTEQLAADLAAANATITVLDAVCHRIAANSAGVRITEHLDPVERDAYLAAIGRDVDRVEAADEPCDDGPELTADDFANRARGGR